MDALRQSLANFLSVELAPSRARWRATARVTVAAAVGVAVTQGFHVPHGAWLVMALFVVAQPDAGASLSKGAQRLVGTFLGCAGSIATIALLANLPWFRLPALGLLVALGLFLSRTTTVPYVGSLAALTAAIFTGTILTDPSAVLADGLWRAWTTLLGVALGTACQLFLWPEDPRRALTGSLASMLEVVAGELRRLVALDAAGAPTRAARGEPSRVFEAAVAGALPQHLALLDSLLVRHSSEREHRDATLVVIVNAARLAVAAHGLSLLLRSESAVPLTDALRARLACAAGDTAALAAELRAGGLRERRAASSLAVPVDERALRASGGDSPLAPLLLEVERAAFRVRRARALGGSGNPAALVAEGVPAEPALPFDLGPHPSLFTPAFSLTNTPDLIFALKGGLAATLCSVAIHALHWPEGLTALVTCAIVAQRTVGATMRKALLRASGAVVGGLLALVALTIVVPFITTLTGLLLVTSVGFGVSAYVVAGSVRISYAGIQLAMAFGMSLLAAFGPNTDVALPFDRVLGILLGIFVYTAVDALVSPALASRAMTGALARALRALAAFSRLGLPSSVATVTPTPQRGFRMQISGELGQARSLIADAALEPGQGEARAVAERERLEVVLRRAEQLALDIGVLLRTRLHVDRAALTSEVSSALDALAVAMSAALERAAAAVEGQPVPNSPLRPLLTRLQAAVAKSAPSLGDAAAGLRAEAALYLGVVSSLDELLDELLASARAAAQRPRPEPLRPASTSAGSS